MKQLPPEAFGKPLSAVQKSVLQQKIAQHYAGALEGMCNLWLNGLHLGYVNAKWRERIVRDWRGRLKNRADGIFLDADDWLSMGDALQHMCRSWHDMGLFGGWRNECFDVFDGQGGVLFALERSAFRPLGLLSRAVHLNGLQQGADGIVRFWIGRRSPYKAVDPNKLDNLVGGGVAAGEKVEDAVRREAWEEAGVPEHLLHGAECLSERRSLRQVSRGLHRETLYIFDVRLPEGFVPENQDGEVAEFVLMEAHDLAEAMCGGLLMNDALLATADCFARHGLFEFQAGCAV